jgi:predicted RNA binding protein YcfA (HicA-like mRNA interferase family)
MPKVETNRADVVTRLLRDGWVLARMSGGHDIYHRPGHQSPPISVPRHRTLSPGVARAIAKVAGWI